MFLCWQLQSANKSCRFDKLYNYKISLEIAKKQCVVPGWQGQWRGKDDRAGAGNREGGGMFGGANFGNSNRGGGNFGGKNVKFERGDRKFERGDRKFDRGDRKFERGDRNYQDKKNYEKRNYDNRNYDNRSNKEGGKYQNRDRE
jgi:hypothetical protein